ncbi:MFS general substrate transporter [Lipomyces oligophaga]|uniref:MFS general substrate transporter n=1 Tax=Lipomyces oligophaga TaxID=45792 RepID=UPI0034CEEFFD
MSTAKRKLHIDEHAVPGTVFLVDLFNTATNAPRSETEKDILLVPAPSDDPEDPLNWSSIRKWRAVSLVHLYTFVVAWSSAGVYSILVEISEATGLSVSQLNSGTGTMLLFFGWGCLLWQPWGLTYGRRGSYIVSLFLTAGISVWTAYSTSYSTWVTQRVLIGLFGAPIECLCEVSITDLYFNHQRGRQIGLYLLALSGGAYIAPLCNGFISQNMGWQWVMYWCAILSGATGILCFFFLEETMYYRETTFEATLDPDSVFNSSAPSETNASSSSFNEKSLANGTTTVPPVPDNTDDNILVTDFPERRSYLQSLALWKVIPERPNEFVRIIFRPFIVAAQLPIVLWSGCFQGVAVCAFSAMNATASVVFSSEPYNFKSSMVGLTYIAPTIGCSIGAIWGGEISDRFCIYLSRRNRGYREAEYRLWASIGLCIIPPSGMILWGVGTAHQVHWVGLVFGMGMLGFAMSTAGCIVIGYTIDSYKEISGETMMSLNIIRCTIAFGFGYAITPWIDRAGYQNGFIEMAFISLALYLTFIFFLFKGKQLRRNSASKYWKLVEHGIRSLQE